MNYIWKSEEVKKSSQIKIFHFLVKTLKYLVTFFLF